MIARYVRLLLAAPLTAAALSAQAPQPRDRWASIKHINLTSDGRFWIGLGGQWRMRAEGWSNFSFQSGTAQRPAPDPDDIFISNRLFLSADLHYTDRLRLFAQAKSATMNNRTLLGSARPVDRDEMDLQNAWVEGRLPGVGPGALSLRAGRQELAYGRERLVSPLEWANTRRTFEGYSAAYTWANGAVSGFLTRPVGVLKYNINKRDSSVAFYGLYGTARHARFNVGTDLYWLGFLRDSASFAAPSITGWNGTVGRENRQTVGGRVWGPIRQGARYDFEVEAATQFGTITGSGIENDISAFMVSAVAGYSFPRFRGARVYAGLDYASGDDTTGGKVGTFSQLFPLAHAYLGFLDVLGRQNIVDLSAGGSMRLWRNLSGNLDLHRFSRASDGDGIYGPATPVLALGSRPAGATTAKGVGTEIDLTLRYTFDRHFVAWGGLSRLSPGDYIKQTAGSPVFLRAGTIDWAYVQLMYTL